MALPLRGVRFLRSRKAAPDCRASIRLSITPVSSPSAREQITQATVITRWQVATPLTDGEEKNKINKNMKKHDDKRERVFKRTYRSANARTRLLPAVIPIVAGESGAPQVHGRPLRSEPHGGHESECDITISLYCTTAWVLSLTARSFFRADCEERTERRTDTGGGAAGRKHPLMLIDRYFFPPLSLSVANTGELSALYKDLVWSRSIPDRSIIV